ncbi:MAG: InlB B-repeat-containing protein [Defluviitaleaceae bacterium]|nr:InlB B-repeat-containing protein [Defluviitaleaceae bacterium]
MRIANKIWGFRRFAVLIVVVMVVIAAPAFARNTALTPPQLTIRFAPSPGSLADDVSGVRTGVFGFRIDEFPEPIPPSGYTFVGWFSDGEKMEAPIVVVRSTTILAAFAPTVNSDTPPSFAVMYSPGLGQLPEGTRPLQSFTYGSALTSLPVPARDGYYFAGWQHNGSILTAPHIVKSDMSLEAVWSDTPQQRSPRPIAIPQSHYVAVFNPFPGVFNGYEIGIRFGRNAAVVDELPIPMRQGYIFNGWRVPGGAGVPSGTILNSEDTLTLRSDIVLMAVWEEDAYAESNGAEASPPVEPRPNPATNPIAISLMIFGAVITLGVALAGICTLKVKQATAEGKYHAYITRYVREMKIVIRNRRNR